MLDAELVETLSAQFVRAITEPRLELLDSLLTDDFFMWYNFNQAGLNRQEALKFFHGYFPTVKLRYDDIQITPTATGWVQQQLVSSESATGTAIRNLATCMVIKVAGRQISRIDEYIDTAQTAGFDAAQMRT